MSSCQSSGDFLFCTFEGIENDSYRHSRVTIFQRLGKENPQRINGVRTCRGVRDTSRHKGGCVSQKVFTGVFRYFDRDRARCDRRDQCRDTLDKHGNLGTVEVRLGPEK